MLPEGLLMRVLPVGMLLVGLLLSALLLGRVAPVVGLLLVAGLPVLPGICRRAVIAWPAAVMRRRR